MRVFVDTSALYAMLDRDDLNHAAAARAWLGLLDEDADLVTTNYVVVETCAILQRRFGAAALRRFSTDVLPALTVLWVDEAIHAEGIAAALASSRRGPSIVDCVSFAAMRGRGLDEVFAFDPHFSDQGFTQRQS